MRVAFVKQLLDTFGPWSSVRWGQLPHEDFLNLWPGKALHWELTTLLKADWFVIPQQVNTDYTYDSVLKQPGHAAIVKKYTRNLTPVRDLPLDDYDLIITHDPILEFPRASRTLFCYFLVEHWDRRYRASLRCPLRNADLFLAHMMDAPAALRGLPQAVSFPYLRDPHAMRARFAPAEREEAIWADWRTISLLSAGTKNVQAVQAAAWRLQHTLQLRVAFRSFSMGLYHAEDPPRWGDATDYLRQLARQKYYLGLGRGGGAGQGLADAASLGCICFGEQDKPYHRLLCHSECLCGDLQDLPKRVKRVRESVDLEREICAWQDAQLQLHFIDAPLALLEDALARKRRSLHGVAKAKPAIAEASYRKSQSTAKAMSRTAP
jgi:hypothetical protein